MVFKLTEIELNLSGIHGAAQLSASSTEDRRMVARCGYRVIRSWTSGSRLRSLWLLRTWVDRGGYHYHDWYKPGDYYRGDH